jgi:DNA-binding winged helix-turn-helix (wHTH) protein
VTRTEIQKTLWEEGRFVEFDHAVNTAIKKVREALEDDPETPRIIETLPRKGYRFIAPVEWVEEPSEQPTPEIASIEAADESVSSVIPEASPIPGPRQNFSSLHEILTVRLRCCRLPQRRNSSRLSCGSWAD